MKNPTLAGFSRVNDYVKDKLRRFESMEPGSASLFELMFSESDNVLYEVSEGYRIVRTTYGEAREAAIGKSAALSALLADCPDADTAWTLLNDNLPLIALAARLRARVCGWEGPVTCEAGVYDFPERVYDGARVPAGKYRAVRVVIGAGEGRNWWCVLYPSLCVPGDWRPGEPVRFYSSILRWLRGLLGAKP